MTTPDSQTITLPLILERSPKLVDFVTLHTPAIPRGASKMITVRVKESIKRMKEAGKFPQRWCQENRTRILASFEYSQAAPLELHRRSPRAPPAELWMSAITTRGRFHPAPGTFQVCSQRNSDLLLGSQYLFAESLRTH